MCGAGAAGEERGVAGRDTGSVKIRRKTDLPLTPARCGSQSGDAFGRKNEPRIVRMERMGGGALNRQLFYQCDSCHPWWRSLGEA
jgi:hypothetical protein